ncbi:MAG: CoxG family protein, partial [Halobacteriales archaeon]
MPNADPIASRTDIEPDDGSPDQATDGGKQLSFSDAVEMPATTEELWATVSDPDVLTECVPGAESIEQVSERRYTLDITRGVSHLTVSLSGAVEFVELNEPEWVVVSGDAHDTKTGSDFDVLAAMELSAVDDATTQLAYRADVSFTGGVASLGAGVLRPIVRRDVDAYFENIRSVVAPPDGA